MSRGPVRRIAANLSLVAVGILLALAIAEIAVRANWRATVDSVYHPPSEHLPAVDGIFDLVRPNVKGIYRGVYYQSNSAGFRGPEYTPDPPPGVFRIAVFGDSFTMGDGVLVEQAYPHLVERKLNRASEQQFEVLNWGLSGVNLRQGLMRLRKLAPQFKPDLIIYGFTANDVEGPSYRRSVDLETQIKNRSRYLHYSYSWSYLVRFAWPRIVSIQELFSPIPGTYLDELLDNFLNNPEAWHDFETALDELVETQNELETPVVVFLHTTLIYLNRFHPLGFAYDQVRDAVHERGLQTIDSFAHFLGHRVEDLWVNELDPHPNDLGHEILARALVDGLEALPDGPLRAR